MSYNALCPLETDWKLFRKNLPIWQENYMAQLNREYQGILAQKKSPSAIFWELEKRIRRDKTMTGVIGDGMSRSNMSRQVFELLHEGVITLEDLSEFSEEFQETVKWVMNY